MFLRIPLFSDNRVEIMDEFIIENIPKPRYFTQFSLEIVSRS